MHKVYIGPRLDKKLLGDMGNILFFHGVMIYQSATLQDKAL